MALAAPADSKPTPAGQPAWYRVRAWLAGGIAGLGLIIGVGLPADAAPASSARPASSEAVARPSDNSVDHRTCTPVAGGVSFQVSGVFNRKYVSGADVTRCGEGWWRIAIYPGGLGRVGGLINGQKAAAVALSELKVRMRLTQAEITSIQNQVFCHAVVPYLPGVSSNIWKLKGAQVWDIETYRPGGQSVAKQAITGCNWAN